MILIHVIVPKDGLPDEYKTRITDVYQSRNTKEQLFVLEVEEEEFTFLKLKYGRDKVWKR